MLQIEYTKAFQRDIKRLKRKHADFSDLKELIRLVAEDTDTAKETLRRRHPVACVRGGDWDGVIECHVGNAGNWLAIWIKEDGTAWFLRTGTHAEILGR